ncbi:hypothetical protein [Deinococcus aquiradiocola]|uniref:Uncharacterized protein n=1 Tax=Deinococcus aquiradiocola TaxID=393059 RepID=A0A917UW95_9DEIO|nr:hypothetical protein [Deinococcus aquiradiocola]GGJ89934.1 hypothetical protein GCM10008939_37370 [Deinococcus aquiradiocola]
MTAPHAHDAAYRAGLQRHAHVLYPEDPAEFRATWTAAGTAAWIQEVVRALSDRELASLAEGLRGTFLHAPGRVMDLWALARYTAGLQ